MQYMKLRVNDFKFVAKTTIPNFYEDVVVLSLWLKETVLSIKNFVGSTPLLRFQFVFNFIFVVFSMDVLYLVFNLIYTS